MTGSLTAIRGVTTIRTTLSALVVRIAGLGMLSSQNFKKVFSKNLGSFNLVLSRSTVLKRQWTACSRTTEYSRDVDVHRLVRLPSGITLHES